MKYMVNDVAVNKASMMIGFRNIAVHDYKTINLAIVQKIIEKHLDDIIMFKDNAVSKFS